MNGIRGNLLLWLEHYFCDQSHQTRVGDSLSSDTSLVSSVILIQGSFGPVAFLIYIDDLAKLLESYGVAVKLLADDVKDYLQIAGADDVTKLQYALDLNTQWPDEWQLSLCDENVHHKNSLFNSIYSCTTYIYKFKLTSDKSEHVGNH